jgi:hypothetical protein
MFSSAINASGVEFIFLSTFGEPGVEFVNLCILLHQVSNVLLVFCCCFLLLHFWCIRLRIRYFCIGGFRQKAPRQLFARSLITQHQIVLCDMFVQVVWCRTMSLPLLRICRIAWELHCLNESSVAHHHPELWAKQVLTSLGGGLVLPVPSEITHWGLRIVPPGGPKPSGTRRPWLQTSTSRV